MILTGLVSSNAPVRGRFGWATWPVRKRPTIRSAGFRAAAAQGGAHEPELGYAVLDAEHADEALAVLDRVGPIALLFTDVVLPGRSGRALADLALERRPGLKVLFTTGYLRNAIVHQGRLDAGVELIGKPFTFEQLASRVREVIDAPSPRE